VDTYLVRVWLPDRPGALGQVASRIGSVRGDVVGIDILETGEGQAVDELVVQLPGPEVVDLLVHEVSQVDGVKVEEVKPLGSAGHDPRLDALETAAILVESSSLAELLDSVCEHAGRSLGASWVAVLDVTTGAPHVATSTAPSPEWLHAFLVGSHSAANLSGLDSHTHAGCSDVAWAPLAGMGAALLVGRDATSYRARERRQLAALARIVDARLCQIAAQ